MRHMPEDILFWIKIMYNIKKNKHTSNKLAIILNTIFVSMSRMRQNVYIY